jgi:hypothetical protein
VNLLGRSLAAVAVGLGCLALGASAHAAGGAFDESDPLAPCQQLAAEARAAPASAWAKGGYGALGAMMTFEPARKTPSAFDAGLIALPEVRKALADEAGDYTVTIQRFGATDLYVAWDDQGTLECQNVVFLRASPGHPAKIVDGPPQFSNLCWTSQGAAGAVLKAPAFIETEGFTDEAPDEEDIEVTRWGPNGWRPACRLALIFKTSFKVTERFCGDQGVCAAAAPLAAQIAARHRQPRPDKTPFRFGSPPTKAAETAFERVPQIDEINVPVFPTFGAKAKTEFPGYSYNGIDLFPLTLKGATHVAAIGYGGVGWREIGDALLAIYQPDGDDLKPLAGFVIARSVTGLASTRVEIPTPDPGM